MKKILVLCSGYPSKENLYNCSWAHTRNRYYVNNGLDVDVYRTDTGESYQIDGVKLIDRQALANNLKLEIYDLIISHSPNIRKHIPIILKSKKTKVLLFMHGSESMAIERDYPKPYGYMANPFYKKVARGLYDELKFKVLGWFIRTNRDRVTLVFVSEWMRGMFESNILVPDLEGIAYEVIHNSLAEVFVDGVFKSGGCKVGDFVTLRSLDNSKYAVDMVVSLAEANPNYSFDIYGRGRFFEFNKIPDNVSWYDKHIRQDDIPELLDCYKVALMPTRCDAQGVMACEIATYGMPLITTDISVNREMFSDFANVAMLKEESFANNLQIHDFCNVQPIKNYKFLHKNTLFRELALIEALS